MFRHYRSTILQIALEIQGYALFIYFLHLSRTSKTIDIYFSTLQLQCSCQITDACTKNPQNS